MLGCLNKREPLKVYINLNVSYASNQGSSINCIADTDSTASGKVVQYILCQNQTTSHTAMRQACYWLMLSKAARAYYQLKIARPLDHPVRWEHPN